MSNKYFVIADIHGEFDKLKKLAAHVREAHPEFTSDFGVADGWHLVQLGDKNDRGPDTYKVFEYFRWLKLTAPANVHLIMGNHEDMLVNAALGKSDLLFHNGGNVTVKSYGKATGLYPKGKLFHSLVKTDHWRFLQEDHVYYHETPQYFFCHAPIAKRVRQDSRMKTLLGDDHDFRQDREMLTWSFQFDAEVDWVEPWLIEKEQGTMPCGGWMDPELRHKICVYGHVHGIEYRRHKKEGGGYTETIHVPGVRRYGNSILLDTGAGCAAEGYLSCLELPTGRVYKSTGEVQENV